MVTAPLKSPAHILVGISSVVLMRTTSTRTCNRRENAPSPDSKCAPASLFLLGLKCCLPQSTVSRVAATHCERRRSHSRGLSSSGDLATHLLLPPVVVLLYQILNIHRRPLSYIPTSPKAHQVTPPHHSIPQAQPTPTAKTCIPVYRHSHSVLHSRSRLLKVQTHLRWSVHLRVSLPLQARIAHRVRP